MVEVEAIPRGGMARIAILRIRPTLGVGVEGKHRVVRVAQAVELIPPTVPPALR